jgi:hypothetical protein
VIRVSVRQQYRIELRECLERDAGSAHSWKQLPQRWIKIGVGENSLSTDLN